MSDLRGRSPTGTLLDIVADAIGEHAVRLICSLVQRCEADPRIEAVVVGGSVARENPDAFSDLDLGIVCRPAHTDQLVTELPGIAAAIGPLLSCFRGEHVGVPELLICLYGPPLLHADLKCLPADGLTSSFEPLALLWGRDGSVQAELADSSLSPPAADPQWIEDRFWVWLHYATTKACRGEVFECVDALSLMRRQALGPLLALLAERPAAGMRRIETYAGEYLPVLQATLGGADRQQCLLALKAAADLYLELRARISPTPALRHSAQDAALEDLDSRLAAHPDR